MNYAHITRDLGGTLARIIYATHVTCDGCGAVEQLPAPSSAPEMPTLPGWLPAGLRLTDLYGTTLISDLCAACLARPLAELLEPQLEAARQAP